MHGDDAGEAYRLALLSDARGAYNVATDPVVDGKALGKLMEARAVQIPKAGRLRRDGGRGGCDLSPLTSRCSSCSWDCRRWQWPYSRCELGWQPRYSGVDALREVMEAMAEGAGGPTRRSNPQARGTEAPQQ